MSSGFGAHVLEALSYPIWGRNADPQWRCAALLGNAGEKKFAHFTLKRLDIVEGPIQKAAHGLAFGLLHRIRPLLARNSHAENGKSRGSGLPCNCD
jgi:hypothetical protein